MAPVVSEFSDLALQVARLAYRNPQWTAAAIASNGPTRDPADLAPAVHDLTEVLAAVHHATDAITRAGAEDQNAVRTAADDDRLYLPTRLMPDDCDIPRLYSLTPPSRARALITSYDTAITSTTRAVTTLDDLAVTLGAPTWTLAALRTPSQHGISNSQFIAPKARATHRQPAARQPQDQPIPITERHHTPSIRRS